MGGTKRRHNYAPGHDKFSDPLGCMTTKRPFYVEDMVESVARHSQGEKQTYCKRCKRWRWPDELAGCKLRERNPSE